MNSNFFSSQPPFSVWSSLSNTDDANLFGTGFGPAASNTGTAGSSAAFAAAPSPFGGQGQRSASSSPFNVAPSSKQPSSNTDNANGFGSGFGPATSNTGTAGSSAAFAPAPSPFCGQGQRSASSYTFNLAPSSKQPSFFPSGQQSSTPASSSFAVHFEKETEQCRSKEAPQEGGRMPENTQTNFSEEGSSKQVPQESDVPGNEKTNFLPETGEGSSKQAPQGSCFSSPSAITGEIPCYFEGTGDSSFRPLQPNCVPTGTGESIKVEKLEKSELNPLSLKIIKVSRILMGIPQDPHFSSLKGYSEVAKQSLINSWDRIFEETIDQIQSMGVNGFWVDARRLWETIQELEDMGYNVIVLRRRLIELTDVMVKLRRHRNDIRGLRRKAEQHRLEKSRLEFQIVKLKAKVEAEKVAYEYVMAKVDKMVDEVPNFDDVFAKLAIKQF